MAIVRRGISLGLHTFGRRLLQALHTQSLERSQRPRARLNRISRRDQVRSRVCDIGSGIRILERLFARIHRPGGDVDLLALGYVERFEERVHVFPAVELAETAEFGLCDGLECIACAIAVDEFLNVCGLDFAAVVDDFASGIDQGLRQVQRRVVDFGETERDVATLNIRYMPFVVLVGTKDLTSGYLSPRGGFVETLLNPWAASSRGTT